MIIGFSGLIGSGKTTVAKSVANRLGAHSVTFSEIMKAEAERRGLDVNVRDALREVGEELASRPGMLARKALMTAGFPGNVRVVLDGIRHVKVWEAIQHQCKSVPIESKLVFLEISPAIRLQRLRKRGISAERIAQLDSHHTEIDVVNSRLRSIADSVLDGDMCSSRLTEIIVSMQSQ